MTRIYLSSTYEDLRECRDAVVGALRKMQKDVVEMGDYVAAGSRPLDKCLADVDSCDVYIGILAWRYGYVPLESNPQGKSITELEYRRADASGKECLLFLLDPDNTSWNTKWMDAITGDGDRGQRIASLRDELMRAKIVSLFKNPQELASLVTIAVANWEETKRKEAAGSPARVPAGVPLRGTEERLRDLDDNIHQALQEIKKWEQALRYEDDPDRRKQCRERIACLRSEWEEYSLEYSRLEATVGGRSDSTRRAADGLRQMDERLGAIPRDERQPGIGLALSGGGFRATLFHLGSLWRLNELGLLGKLSEVSSVSAGSILAGILGLRWKDLEFGGDGVATNFAEVIAARVRALCSRPMDVPSILVGLLFPFRNPGDVMVSRLQRYVFGEATLQDLPEHPRLTFYATSLQTGESVRFSRAYLADHRLGVVWNPRIPLAQAVGASCAAPPVFCPVVVSLDPDSWERTDGADLHQDRNLRSRLALADGGLYDDLALEKVWDRYETVLVSDAGLPFRVVSGQVSRFASRLARAVGIMASQAHNLRKRKLFEDYSSRKMGGAYWGIAIRIGDYRLEEQGMGGPMAADSDLTRSLSQVRTRFNPFSAEEQGLLINWGYATTDAAIRRHVIPQAPLPGKWPVPQRPL